MDVTLTSKRNRLRHVIILAIPLSLSAFMHLWNPIGFPYFVGDEGHYIRRALYVMDQMDPQEGARYDHPYFGQLFLAGLFKLIGYPDSLNPVSGDVNSTQMLYMVPRIIIGLLAVLDTYLIYKICERLYTRNKAIAFIGSILFAVMPLTWLTRRIYLDSIQVPLILLSILLAVYFYNYSRTRDNSGKGSAWRLGELIDKGTLLIILSGVTLGLAIFTKIPALTMIPVIAYLIIRSDKEYKERIKNLGLWLIPVILIPAIWPAYAISVGEYDNWYNGVFSQAGREGSGLGSLQILFKIDPVLVSIGIIGLIFAILKKRDIFLLLWIIPFLAFHIVVPWTQHFHWIQVLPVFCIAGAVLFEGLASMRWGANHTWTHGSLDDYLMDGGGYGLGRKLYRLYQRYRIESPNKIITIVTVTIILIFGMISTTMLVASNVNASFIEMVSFIGLSLPEYRDVSNEFDRAGESRGLCLWCTTPVNKYEENLKQKETKESNEDNKVTVVGNHWIFGSFWIPKYVFNKDHIFKGFFTNSSVETEKVFIVADSRLLDAISSENPNENIEELKSLYDNLTTLATFEENRPDYDENMYPYQSMSENRGIGNIEIRANY